MSITFRCQHCHKQVDAPNAAGGKQGKCPFCGMSTYIPAPVSEDEVLDVVPLDEDEERRQEEELKDLLAQEDQLLAEKDPDGDLPSLNQREDLTSEDLHHFVVNYCLDMSQSQLERAQLHSAKLKKFGYLALEAVDDFVSGKAIEPALSQLPAALVQGFLKQLREQLS